MAVYVWSMDTHIEFSSDRTVDSVKDLANDQPQQSCADMTIYHRLERDDSCQGSGCSEEMNAEPGTTS